MTTPDTSAVRAWARDNGFDVADRGRLPAEVVDAYTASRTKPAAAGKAAAEKAPAKRAATKKAPARKAPAKPAVTRTAAARRTAKQARAEMAAAAPAPAPAPDPTEEFADASLEAITTDPPAPHAAKQDGELQRLAEQVRALTDRVAALEERAAAQPEKPVKSRFRRSR